jgi:hypothetical protein
VARPEGGSFSSSAARRLSPDSPLPPPPPPHPERLINAIVQAAATEQADTIRRLVGVLWASLKR